MFTAVARGYAKNHGRAPKGIQSFFEPIIVFIRDEVAKKSIGPRYERYMPYLLTVFFFIWFNNLLGLMPGAANLTGNIAVTLTLAALTLIITPLSFYNLVPPSALLPADSPYSDPSWGGLSNGRDKRHDAAARALTEARQAAKDGGMAKREAMGFVSFPCLPS